MMTARRAIRIVLTGCACFAAANVAAEDEAPAQVEDSIEPAVTGTTLDEAGAPSSPRSPVPPVSPIQDELRATDTLDLGRTEVTGNQELPKVLYIVPWQKSDPGSLLGRPVNTLLDEVLAPLDREEFIRQVDYYSDLDDSQDE